MILKEGIGPNPTEEAIKAILKSNLRDEEQCRELFDCSLSDLRLYGNIVMLFGDLFNTTLSSSTKEDREHYFKVTTPRYKNNSEIPEEFKYWYINAPYTELKVTRQKLQQANDTGNLKHECWSCLYDHSGPDFLTPKKSYDYYGTVYLNWWKTIKEYIQVIKDIIEPKGFFTESIDRNLTAEEIKRIGSDRHLSTNEKVKAWFNRDCEHLAAINAIIILLNWLNDALNDFTPKKSRVEVVKLFTEGTSSTNVQGGLFRKYSTNCNLPESFYDFLVDLKADNDQAFTELDQIIQQSRAINRIHSYHGFSPLYQDGHLKSWDPEYQFVWECLKQDNTGCLRYWEGCKDQIELIEDYFFTDRSTPFFTE